jgi:anti-anti-sigma factor
MLIEPESSLGLLAGASVGGWVRQFIPQSEYRKEAAMPTVETQIWKSARLTIERAESDAEGSVFRFSGPFTARDIYHSLSPDAFRNIFEPAPGSPSPAKHIFDLTAVPYMDSLGLGMLASHYVRCKGNGIPLSITGISPRVEELFRITKMDTVLPIAAH